MSDFVPHSRPTITDEDRCAVDAALREGAVGPGAIARRLAAEVAHRAGRDFARTTRSGTEALRDGLGLLGLPPGALVAVPVLTCPSVVAVCTELGLRVWLTGLNEDLTIDVSDVGDDVAAVVAPHAWGAPVDAAALDRLGRPWIEDAATSPAARTVAGAAGAAGTLAVFSFGPTKYLTGGMGGCLVGDLDTIVGADAMPDVNASLAAAQLDRIALFRERRRGIADRYDAALDPRCAAPRPRTEADCAYRYLARTSRPSAPAVAALHAAGIGASPSPNPWLDELALPAVTRLPGDGPWRAWRGHTLSIPLYPSLSEDELGRVCRALHSL